jgi:tRNA(Ile)-lysidine synthase
VHIDQAVEVAANGSTGSQAILPHGLQLTVGYETLRIIVGGQAPTAPDWPLLWQDEPIPLAIPGKTTLPKGERPARNAREHEYSGDSDSSSTWCLEARIWSGERDKVTANADRWTAYLDADQVGSNPTLRRRRSGDRFQPLGMGGNNVQVAGFFINAKVPRRWRPYIPLLVHDRLGSLRDEIAWLVGWRIDERVKVTSRTRRVVRLRCFRFQTFSA